MKNDSTTDAGFDLILDGITSPVTGDVGVTRIDVGTGTTIVRMDSANPLFAQLTAGTAGIGKLTANAGVTIGAVEIAASQTIAVTNAGTFVVQVDGAALTALQLIDDIVHSGDAVLSKYAAIGAVFDDTTPGTVTENQAQSLRMSPERYLYTEIRDAAGNERGAVVDSSGFFTTNINGTVTVAAHAVTNAGTFAVQSTLQAGTAEIGKLAAGVAEIGNVKNAGVFVVQIDGAALTALQLLDNAISGSEMQVDVVAALPAGTNAIGKLAANSGVDIGDVDVTSQVPGTGATNLGKAQDTAVGSTDTGVAMLAQRDDEQAAVTPVDGDYVVPKCDKFGNLKVTQQPDATSVVKFAVINAASGDNEIVAAAGVGVKIRVLNVVLVAGGTTDCRFESAAGGTALTGIMKLVAQSGFAPGYCPVGHFETADNAALSLECTGDIDGWLSYVEI